MKIQSKNHGFNESYDDNKLNVFHSAHPTGWAESISGNGVCMYVCPVYVRHHFKDDEYLCLQASQTPYNHTYSESL